MRRTRQGAFALLLLMLGLMDATPMAAADPGRETDWVWPSAGRISQQYGCTGAWTNGPSGRCRHFHNGIDIANAEGTPIQAARPGLVTYVGWNPWERQDPAWIVMIDHGDGLTTWYAHMLPRRVVGAGVGSWVQSGDVVGWMGNTGRSTGVHLHFMIQQGRDFLDPRMFLAGSPPGRAAEHRGDGTTVESLIAQAAAVELTPPVFRSGVWLR